MQNDVSCGTAKTDINKQELNPSQTNTDGWGGMCRCPNGAQYAVAAADNTCTSLACEGGVMENCRRKQGDWSFNKARRRCYLDPNLDPNLHSD